MDLRREKSWPNPSIETMDTKREREREREKEKERITENRNTKTKWTIANTWDTGMDLIHEKIGKENDEWEKYQVSQRGRWGRKITQPIPWPN